PALAVYTPPASSPGESSARRRIAFVAPRSLKDPIGCKHSSFSQISRGVSAYSRTRGVRSTVPPIRVRAAAISSSVLGASVGVVTYGAPCMLSRTRPENKRELPARDHLIADVVVISVVQGPRR